MQTINFAPHSDAQLRSFPDTESLPEQLHPAALDISDASDLMVELATERASDPTFCFLWQALVADSRSPQKIYQTPAFFKFLQQACYPGDRLELLTVTRRSDGALVGVVPVRINKRNLDFKFGPLTLHSAQVEMIYLLGSIPAAPSGSDVAAMLATRMLAQFPAAKAVQMAALPVDSAYWDDLSGIGASGGVLSTSLTSPWRACHTMPLPAAFDQYLEKFSAKKRYNLHRQIRQLSEQVGELELERVEQPGQVAGMMRSLEALVARDGMKSVLSEKTFVSLAAQGLLLCHVLRAGDQVLAATIGTRSPDTLHVHNIFVEKKHLALSIGTSAMHLVIKDLAAMGGLKMLDFGYGTPNHEFRSSHVLETRAEVLLFDNTKSISLLFFIHRHFVALSEGLICKIKSFKKQLQSMRNLLPA